jgi:hypothetical protein
MGRSAVRACPRRPTFFHCSRSRRRRRSQMSRLRTEQQQLQAAIDLLASHGGRAELRNCGTSNEHLCVRVEPGLGRFGEAKDYFVIRGY